MRQLLTALAPCLAAPGTLRAQEEVPFVATPDHLTLAMRELAQVGPQDVVLDLGSGDGRIVILTARRFGARGLGAEIVPELVERSQRNATKAGVADRARFVEQGLCKPGLSQAAVITMYLLQEVNLQLRPGLLALRAGTRIVSHDWDQGDRHPDRSLAVGAPDKPVGREKFSRLHQGGGAGPGRRRLVRHWRETQRSAAQSEAAQDEAALDAALSGPRNPAVAGPHAPFAGRTLRRHQPAQRQRLRGRCRRRARACHAQRRRTAVAQGHRVQELQRLSRAVQATPCICSWRSAAAARSAAKPGSVSR